MRDASEFRGLGLVPLAYFILVTVVGLAGVWMAVASEGYASYVSGALLIGTAFGSYRWLIYRYC